VLENVELACNNIVFFGIFQPLPFVVVKDFDSFQHGFYLVGSIQQALFF
jgi:hypothetical protein